MFCVGPLANLGIFNTPLDSDDYECLRDDIKDWNPKWYSPVCRGWYKKAIKEYKPQAKRSISTNLYKNAAPSTGKTDMCITSCAPFSFSNSTFAGTLCLDQSPMGPLDTYFDFK